MYILMLNYEFPPLGGGAANANKYLLDEFSQRKDLRIDFITSSANNKNEIVQFSENIRIFRLNVKKRDVHFWRMGEIVRWTWSAYKLSRKLVKENYYDVCHCWFGWPSGIIGYLLKNKIPYIVALRGSDVPGYNMRLQWQDKIIFSPLSRIVWRNASVVVANSEGLRQLALKTFARDIGIIYNGINTIEFRPILKTRTSVKMRIVSTGRLIERKGYDILLNALVELKDIFSLTLIGEGDQEERLRKMAERLKIDVTFKGAVSHNKIVDELQKADLFVLPSLNEGMSNSILEAMACGLPIITTDTGGASELIKNNGFIISKNSSNELRAAILKYAHNKKLLSTHGKLSRNIAEKMSWEKVSETYLEVYKSCAE